MASALQAIAGRWRRGLASPRPAERCPPMPRLVRQPRSDQRVGAIPRPPFDTIALLLQGGGSLGAYQGGVYQALAEADLHPNWVAGISIGAINAAIIAGNPPERRVDQLRAFWDTVTGSPLGSWADPWFGGGDQLSGI